MSFFETRELHRKEELRTNWYQCTYQDAKKAIFAIAEELGYATDNKLYKANPEAYKGNTAKACEFVRLALTGRKNSPDLYEIMKILGNEKVNARFKTVLN